MNWSAIAESIVILGDPFIPVKQMDDPKTVMFIIMGGEFFGTASNDDCTRGFSWTKPGMVLHGSRATLC